MVLDELVVKITKDTAGLKGLSSDVQGELDAAEGKVSKWGSRMNTAANYSLAAGGLLAAGVGAATKTTIAFGQSVDDITDLSNLSAEAASTLSGQMQYFDLSAQSAGMAVKFFEKNLDAARQGGESQAEAFERLGISVEELQSLGDSDLLFETRDAMASLEDKTERTALTLQLFGRSGDDLADWLDAAPSEIAELNEQLEAAGLIWDVEKIKNWQDLIDAQREMRISMMGLQTAVAQPEFIGAITALVTQLTRFLQIIRPLMPALPYLTGALLTFGGVVKGIQMYQFVRGLFSASKNVGTLTTVAGRAPAALSNLGGALRTLASGGLTIARGGFSKLATLVRNLPALLTSTGGVYGAVAAGIAVDTVLIYEAVDAWQQWRDAIKQAKEAAEDSLAADAKAQAQIDAWKTSNPGQNLPSGLQKLQDTIYQNPKDYSTPWWAKPSMWFQDLIGMSGGGIARGPESGYLAVLHGTERVTKEPLPKDDGGGGQVVFNLNIDKVIGTDERAARQLWKSLKPIVMSEQRLKGAMSRG